MSGLLERIAALPAEKRALFAHRHPLSFAQRRLWFLDRLEPGRGDYNVPAALRFVGPLDVRALEKALERTAERHAVLRTVFPAFDGEPIQVALPPAPVLLPRLDLRALVAPARAAEARRLAELEARRPFDLGRGPLLRAALVVEGGCRHVFLLSLHHAVCDGWARELLLGEVSALYRAFAGAAEARLPELPIQYADFARWQRDWLASEAARRELIFWRRHLEGAPTLLELPFDRPRGGARSRVAGRSQRWLEAAWTPELRRLEVAAEASLFMIGLSAFLALLHRDTGARDLVVGTPVTNRSGPETQGLVGLFLNMLALRVRLAEGLSFRRLLEAVRAETLEATEHQRLPFELLVDELQPERNLGVHPIFQVTFTTWQPSPPPPAAGDLRVEQLPVAGLAAKYDLSVTVSQRGGRLGIGAEWNEALFDRSTAERLLGRLETLLHAALEDPERRLGALPYLGPSELRQVLGEWNDTARTLPVEATVFELFERWAERAPEAIAAVCGARSLSYRELARRARRLGRRLEGAGVGAEVLVGVCVERDLEMAVSLLGVLAAGGAYVPLDPAFPAERLAFMAADAGLRAVVCGTAVASPAEGPLRVEVGTATDGAPAGPDGGSAGQAGRLTAEHTAYVIYTSGSTGRPKGVQVSHRSLSSFLTSMAQRPGLGPDDALLAVTTLSFDIAALELFLPLTVGARVEIADVETCADGGRLARYLGRSRASAMQATPVTWRMLLEAGWRGDGRLAVLCGGEALAASLAERLASEGGSAWNLYGPTETTVWSTVERIAAGDRPGNVGRPIANTAVHVLDRGLRPVPIGIAGRLAIGGAGVARGYRRRPALTAERFVPDPWSADAGGRLYDTGDLGRRLADGRLEVLGRGDHQVKVRGHRIELGEVEAVLAGLGAVREAAVVVDRRPEGDRLVAFWVAAGEARPSGEELRGALAERLPAYMLPSLFVRLEALPLTPNRKLDRRALEALRPRPSSSAGYAAPRDPVEEALCGAWESLLQVPRVGVRDNFFELGGHSLLATRVTARIRSLFAVEVPVRRIFETPTVAGLARAVVAAMRGGAGSDAPPLERVSRRRPLPLSYAQQRMWFVEQMVGTTAAYHLHAALRLEGRLDPAALERALEALVERHEGLRTRFPRLDGEPAQVIDESTELRPAWLDLRRLGAERAEAEARRAALAGLRRPFDLESGGLARLLLLRLGDHHHLAVWVTHHVVSDGWSIGLVLDELVSCYAAFAAGAEPGLPPLPIQYADFACWQRRWLRGAAVERELAYWRRQLGDGPPRLELATDRPRPALQRFRGAAEPFRLAAATAGALRVLTRERGVTLFMLLLGALLSLLHRYTGQADLTVGTPVANRGRLELEGVLGVFVNMLALRVGLDGEPSFAELLGRVRRTALEAYAHQDLPFEKLVEALQPERSLSHTPLFQVVFALQNLPAPREAPGELAVTPVELEATSSKFDLTLVLGEGGGVVGGKLTYDTDLFDTSTARRLLGHLRCLLAAVAADSGRRTIAELPLLSSAERHQLEVEGAAAGSDEAAAVSLASRFAARAAERPEAVALRCEDHWLSYGELRHRSLCLARRLAARGATLETRVAVFLERSPEMVVALLGILEAGAAYVPLDLHSPAERLAFLLTDSRASLLLTSRGLSKRLPASTPPAVYLEDLWGEELAAGGSLPRGRLQADSAAYVIYTSGSTGRPKGVVVSHRNVVRLLDACQRRFGFGAADVWTFFHSYAFDFSIWEIFGALLHGGCLVVVPYLSSRSPRAFYRLLVDGRVTVLSQTPSAFYQLMEARRADAGAGPVALRTVVFGGEALDLEGLVPWWRRHGADRPRLVNMFGITETTVHVTYRPLEAGAAVGPGSPIGRALDDLRTYLLDRRGRSVPLGVHGELHVGGPGLARGYLGRSALTAERFVPDPFAECGGERLYRSGDLARRLGDGELEYLGRIDEQVKIRGFRIELGEVTTALKAHPAVAEAAVVVVEGEAARRRLVAYVSGEELPPADSLRAFLGRHLPEHMLPEAFVELAALPLTVNGKLDRKALPPPPAVRPELTRGYSPPRGATEELVAGVWARVLGLDRVGRDDDFFELGGHSMLATRATARLGWVVGAPVELRALFEHPTVAALAAHLDRAREASAGLMAPPLEAVPRGAELPLSFAQEQLWYLQQRAPESGAYNQPLAVRLRGLLDVPALAAALGEVERRHEVLRTLFPAQLGRPLQRILPPQGPVIPPLIDLGGLEAAARRAESRRLAVAEGLRPFDLTRRKPWRSALLRLAGDEHVALLTLHHVASDGSSLGILVREIGALYPAALAGAPSPLPEPSLQYVDFAVWQRRRLEGAGMERLLTYWRRRLGPRPASLELTADRPRSAAAGGSGRPGARRRLLPGEDLSRGLRVLAAEEGATLYMVLLAAFEVVLHHHSGRSDLVVGTNVAGRTRVETEGLIGCFINQLVLRTDLGGDPSFRQLVQRVRGVCLEAYAHQELPYDRLVAELEGGGGGSPLYRIKAELQADLPPPLELPALTLEPLGLDRATVRYDLHLLWRDDGRRLRGELMYDAALFEPATAEGLALDYDSVLETVSAAPETRLGELSSRLGDERRRRSRERRARSKKGHAEGIRQIRRQTVPVLPAAN